MERGPKRENTEFLILYALLKDGHWINHKSYILRCIQIYK